MSYVDGSVYAVAHTDWWVNFFAQSVNGVPTVQVPRGVVSLNVFSRNNDNPWTAGPPFNDFFASPAYGWQPAT